MPDTPTTARRLLHALLVLALLAPAPMSMAAPLPEPAATSEMPCHDAAPEPALDDCCTPDEGCMTLCTALVSAGALPATALAAFATFSAPFARETAPLAPLRRAASPPLRPPSR
jgi:hypothetical protein